MGDRLLSLAIVRTKVWIQRRFEGARRMKCVTTIERMAGERAKSEEKRSIALNLLRQGIAIEPIA
jgi:hypothetical protein